MAYTNDEVIDLARKLEEIKLNGSEEALEEIQNKLNETLYQSALTFKNATERLTSKIIDLEKLFQRQKDLRKSIEESEGEGAYRKSQEYIQQKQAINAKMMEDDLAKEWYHIHFAFQEALNAVLGQKIQMVFVYDNGVEPELYDLMGHDLLTYEASSSAKLNARYPAVANSMEVLDLIHKNDNNWKFSLSGLKNTYREVIHRYHYSKEKLHNLAKGKSYAKIGKVMWKLADKWDFMKVSSEGDINEAYAMFVLKNNEKPSFTEGIENNVRDYAIEGIKHVDNVSGMLQGDVSINGIEYGIKSAKASTLGLKQLGILANKILNKNGKFSIDDLKKEKERLRKKGKERNAQEEYSESIYNEIYDVLDMDNFKNVDIDTKL